MASCHSFSFSFTSLTPDFFFLLDPSSLCVVGHVVVPSSLSPIIRRSFRKQTFRNLSGFFSIVLVFIFHVSRFSFLFKQGTPVFPFPCLAPSLISPQVSSATSRFLLLVLFLRNCALRLSQTANTCQQPETSSAPTTPHRLDTSSSSQTDKNSSLI